MRLFKFFIVSSLLFCVVLACNDKGTSPLFSSDSPEAVYYQFLEKKQDAIYKNWGKQLIILINDSTRTQFANYYIERIKKYTLSNFADYDTTLWSQYLEDNQTKVALPSSITEMSPNVIFASQYSGSMQDSTVYGTVTFSNVTVNSSGDQAFLFVREEKGPMNDEANFYYFRYNGEKWEIAAYINLWVS